MLAAIARLAEYLYVACLRVQNTVLQNRRGDRQERSAVSCAPIALRKKSGTRPESDRVRLAGARDHHRRPPWNRQIHLRPGTG